MQVMQFENVDGRRRLASHEFRDIGIVFLPVGVFPVKAGKALFPGKLGSLPVQRMAKMAAREIYRISAEKLDGLAIRGYGRAVLVIEPDDGVLIRLEVPVRYRTERPSSPAVVEGRQRQPQRVPEIGRCEGELDVFDLRDQGIGEDFVAPCSAGIGERA